MTNQEKFIEIWEQDNLDFLTTREMGRWLNRRDNNIARRIIEDITEIKSQRDCSSDDCIRITKRHLGVIE